MMTHPALSLWEAYQLETLRSRGLDDSTLLTALEEKNKNTFTEIDDSFDYQELIDAAEGQLDEFKEALYSGYTIKFLTKFGIKNLLKLKYGLDAEKDYSMQDNRFDHLTLNDTQLEEVRLLVSPYWHVFKEEKEDTTYNVSIKHDTIVNQK